MKLLPDHLLKERDNGFNILRGGDSQLSSFLNLISLTEVKMPISQQMVFRRLQNNEFHF